MVKIMRYYSYDVVLTDVPGEICLAFSIAGCNLGCKGCFWQSIQDAPTEELSDQLFAAKLNEYHGLISGVLFYGGEWLVEELIPKLQLAQSLGLKTCLYTGRQIVSAEIRRHLDYLKTGGYREDLGGLTSPTTNQRFINVNSGEDLTHLFWKVLPSTRKTA